jgi:hypothetical protein
MKRIRIGLVCFLSLSGWIALFTGHWIAASFAFCGAAMLELTKRA